MFAGRKEQLNHPSLRLRAKVLACLAYCGFACVFVDLQSLKHNSNGRFVTVCGDGEYVVYTALAWRNKSFGR